MKSVGGLDTSMYKELSTKKTSKDRSAIRRKLERIKRKLRAGGRLTPAEKEFLRKYAPGGVKWLFLNCLALTRAR